MMPPDKMHELGEAMATALASAIKENPNDNVAVHRAIWDRQSARIAELEDCIRAMIEAAYAPIDTRQGVVERARRTLEK